MTEATLPEVTYVLPSKVGGLATIVANLLKFRRRDATRYRAVLTENVNDPDARYAAHDYAGAEDAWAVLHGERITRVQQGGGAVALAGVALVSAG